MAPAGRLVLCEEKIQGKAGLAPHRGLAELRSLSIPGTYQEKITHRGNSSMNLTGLKSLDLSRNSLVSLEGIEYLAALERLSVYYNRISSLAEVIRLHCLRELAEVHFWLNPVVESKSDYRLFVVRVLPRLRQLRDRPVRESERRVSRLHVASEESLDSKHSFPAVFRVERLHHSGAKCAAPSAKKCLVTDADDGADLNLIAECEWGLSSPPGSTSSSQQEQEASFQRSKCFQEQCYFSEIQFIVFPFVVVLFGVLPLLVEGSSHGPLHVLGSQCGLICWPLVASLSCAVWVWARVEALGWRWGTEEHRSQVKMTVVSVRSGHEHLPGTPWTPRTPPWLSPSFSEDKFIDAKGVKSLACSGKAQEAKGVWREAPGPCGPGVSELPGGGPEPGPCSRSAAWGPKQQRPHSVRELSQVCPKLHLAVPPGKKPTLEVALLDLLPLLESGRPEKLVPLDPDRINLHPLRASSRTVCFPSRGAGPGLEQQSVRSQARHILSSVQEFTATQDSSTTVSEEISSLTMENKSLQSCLAELQQQYSVKMSEVVSELSDTRKEMDHLRQHLDRTLEESSSWKSLPFSVKKEVRNADAPSTPNLQITGFQTGVERLSGETVELKQRLEHYDRIQELTRMLQESRRSLVSTNEHLLQELGRVQAQHQAEVEPLHWSHRELKKTAALCPSRPPTSAP
ncbi:PREDICTED: LOW QUALITY PROTEIN: centrosomal protein 72kDa [Lipotes vexillifer]|uniref:Centrosomal protein of 72 kDa n=1 Tax=Lipotes vexillifer TaxID=118797 RepID=A0A340YJ93_LIPVE|nr:PREDICTED: LOW QUALITY PROTEIN: centrosomal protein 72kDa [Lipotes vexillifer]